MARNDEDRYVTENQDRGGWDVVKEDHKRASTHEDTQKEAIADAKRIVNNSGEGKGEVRIQGENGQFRDGISGHHNETDAPDKKH